MPMFFDQPCPVIHLCFVVGIGPNLSSITIGSVIFIIIITVFLLSLLLLRVLLHIEQYFDVTYKNL